MKRRDFFKRISIAAAVVTVAPSVAVEMCKPCPNKGLLLEIEYGGATYTYRGYFMVTTTVEEMDKDGINSL